MKRETITAMLNAVDPKFLREAEAFYPGDVQASPERIIPMNMKKRILSIALAAVLILALGVTAYAIWSIHIARQEEIRGDLQIDENDVTSYIEFEVPEAEEEGLVLLSSVNDGQSQRLYANLSPVTEEEAAAFPGSFFSWGIAGTDIGGFAAPQLPVELSLSGEEAIRNAVLQFAYDRESKTLTVECLMDLAFLDRARSELNTESLPLVIRMSNLPGGGERSFGPVQFSPTEAQRRVFEFGPAVYHDRSLDKELEIVSLELSPFTAVWSLRYEGAAAFHRPDADWEAYAPWSALEDKVGIETKIIFSDGSSFSTGGAVTCPFEDGLVKLHCGWGRAINIDKVEKIVLGDLVLWENK